MEDIKHGDLVIAYKLPHEFQKFIGYYIESHMFHKDFPNDSFMICSDSRAISDPEFVRGFVLSPENYRVEKLIITN